jgi:hypothetical protein
MTIIIRQYILSCLTQHISLCICLYTRCPILKFNFLNKIFSNDVTEDKVKETNLKRPLQKETMYDK